MMIRAALRWVISAAVFVGPASHVLAAVPPSLPEYEINLGIYPGGPGFVPSNVLMFINTLNTSVLGYGLPTPVSNESGLPVTVVGGSSQPVVQSTPTETNTAIAATSTNFGAPGNFHSLAVQAQGQPMCVTFGTGTPTAPSTAGVCAVGMYLAVGQGFTYPIAAIPSSQGKAAAAATGGTLWESTQ